MDIQALMPASVHDVFHVTDWIDWKLLQRHSLEQKMANKYDKHPKHKLNAAQHWPLVDTHSFVDRTLLLQQTALKLLYHLLQLLQHENSLAQKVLHQLKSETSVFQTSLKHRQKRLNDWYPTPFTSCARIQETAQSQSQQSHVMLHSSVATVSEPNTKTAVFLKTAGYRNRGFRRLRFRFQPKFQCLAIVRAFRPILIMRLDAAGKSWWFF